MAMLWATHVLDALILSLEGQEMTVLTAVSRQPQSSDQSNMPPGAEAVIERRIDKRTR